MFLVWNQLLFEKSADHHFIFSSNSDFAKVKINACATNTSIKHMQKNFLEYALAGLALAGLDREHLQIQFRQNIMCRFISLHNGISPTHWDSQKQNDHRDVVQIAMFWYSIIVFWRIDHRWFVLSMIAEDQTLETMRLPMMWYDNRYRFLARNSSWSRYSSIVKHYTETINAMVMHDNRYRFLDNERNINN